MAFILFSLFYSLDIDYGNWPIYANNNTNPPLFIFVFASWCPHCHDLVSPFQNLQKKYERSDQIVAATLNCTIQMDLCAAFHIKSFPSFIFFYKSQIMGFLNPERDQKGIEFMIGQVIKYYEHDKHLIGMLYNGKIDKSIPRFVCRIDKDSEKYSEALQTIKENGLVINETFFFDPENMDLKRDNCKVYFSENQTKIMDSKIMDLNEFINSNKIGFFSKSWSFEKISNLKKFFVLVIPNNQYSIDPELVRKFDEYFAFGSIDQLGSEQIKNLFKIDLEKKNQTCIIIIRIKNINKKKIKYQIINDPDSDKIQTFLNKATVKGQIQWDEVDEKISKNYLSDGIILQKRFDLDDKYKITIIGAIILLVGCLIIGYFIVHYIQNRSNNKEE